MSEMNVQLLRARRWPFAFCAIVLAAVASGYATPGGRGQSPDDQRDRAAANPQQSDWDVLGGTDGTAAAEAVARLSRSPTQALDLIEDHWGPFASAGGSLIPKWIRELDDSRFDVREAAQQKLLERKWFAQSQLRAALAAGPSVEAKARLEYVLGDPSESGALAGHQRRLIRVEGILQSIDSPRAKAIQQAIVAASGAPAIDPRLPPLLDRLYSADAAERAESANLIVTLGDAALPALPKMIEMLGDGETFRQRTGTGTVDYQVQLAIPRLGAVAVDPLVDALLHSPDEKLRARAVAALAMVPDERAIEPVLQALSDPDAHIALAAVNSLSFLGPKAVERLIGVLQGENPLPDRPVPDSLRYRIARELGEIGDPRAIPPIARMLVDADSGLRSVGLESLVKIGAPATEALAQALSHQAELGNDEAFKVNIVSAIGRIAPPESLFDLLAGATQDPQYDVRSAALNILSHRMPAEDISPKYWNLLLDGLNHPDPSFRATAAAAAGGAPKSIRPTNQSEISRRLVELLNDADPRVRIAAISAAGSWRIAAAAEVLLPALGDKDNSVADRAAAALGSIGDPRAVEPLRVRLQSLLTREELFDYSVAVTIAALGKLGDRESVETLIGLLDQGDGRIERAAAAALGEIGDRRAVKPLIAKLDGDAPMLHTVALALGEIRDPQAIQPLLYAGPSTSALGPLSVYESGLTQPNQNAVVWPLYQFGRSAIDPLTKALDDPSPHIREVASWVLYNLTVHGDLQAQERRRVADAMAPNLGDSSEVVRFHAAMALGHLHDLRALPTLVELIGAVDQVYLKLDAADYIGQIGSRGAMGPLTKWLRDERSWVRAPAARALGRLDDPDVIPTLLPVLNDEDSRVRVEAILALGRLGARPAIEPLTAAVQDDDPNVREAAEAALKLLQSAP